MLDLNFTPVQRVCACGCRGVVPPARSIRAHAVRIIRKGAVDAPPGICACGCKEPVPPGEFIRGHNARVAHPMTLERVAPNNPTGPNPSGLCSCGCQGQVGIADRDNTEKGLKFGMYVRYLPKHGNWATGKRRKPPNESELCQCGCGSKTAIATRSAGGDVKGFPRLYLPGHSRRLVYTIDPASGCWLMPINTKDGYVRIRRGGPLVLAHVWYYEHIHGPIPAGLECDHTCGHRNCVNPAHVLLETHSVNRHVQQEAGHVGIGTGYMSAYEERRASQNQKQKDRLSYIVDERGCWLLPFYKSRTYVRLSIDGRMVMAHQLFYERKHGPVSNGLVLDHFKCENPLCVNPDHVEPVTQAENTRRYQLRRLAVVSASQAADDPKV